MVVLRYHIVLLLQGIRLFTVPFDTPHIYMPYPLALARETRSRRKRILSKQTPRFFVSYPVLVDPFPLLADSPSLE
ncbi:hypothetical protein E4T47_02111 [Aureobasidium subglaciale]|nr:hypothetical protein E4T47_02111 [Aureobasidium subglaciale]